MEKKKWQPLKRSRLKVRDEGRRLTNETAGPEEQLWDIRNGGQMKEGNERRCMDANESSIPFSRVPWDNA